MEQTSTLFDALPKKESGVVCLEWSNGYTPSFDDEQRLLKFFESRPLGDVRGIDLPPQEMAAIMNEAPGFSRPTAMSLRRQFIRKKKGFSFFKSKAMTDVHKAQEYANFWEVTVGDHLDKLGLKQLYLTEKDLIAQGSKYTPDFTFAPGTLKINGCPINWIDCKTYYGSSALASSPKCKPELPVQKMKKQSCNYVDAFGPGCFVFKSGFSRDLARLAGFPEGVICLDSTPVCVTELDGDEPSL